ncbi:WD40 repeat domain-containing protein [Kibdelosporangium banguiense]|uniref:WD40 repeat domain-containing protein n=1 Tax=Kibdelosporangium banguiense TaxID=1365924 RepID=UPI003558D545
MLKGQPDIVVSLDFSPDGNRLAAVSSDASTVTWDVAGPTMTSSPLSTVTDVTYHPNGHVVATSDLDGIIRLWDTRTRRETAVLTTKTAPAWDVAFSPNGRLLAAVNPDAPQTVGHTASRKSFPAIPLNRPKWREGRPSHSPLMGAQSPHRSTGPSISAIPPQVCYSNQS